MRRIRMVVPLVLTLVLMVVLAACNTAAPSGSLKVTVTGLPGGVSAAVTVSGPAGYSHAITATTTLNNLTPGTYTVTVKPASDGNGIVATLYDGSVSSSSATVAANATATATVSYAVRPGTGHLWIPLSGGALEVESLPASNLAASGAASPDVTLGTSTNAAEAVAFDGSGNLWVADYNGYVYRYDAASLGSSSATPSVTIDATAYTSELYALAFDAAGDLWISLYDNYQLLEYTPNELTTSGSPTPAVVISDNGSASLSGVSGFAFDASGALWAADFSNDTVVKFTPSQIAATGAPTPAVTISGSGLSEPNTVTFDKNGNLWVSNHTLYNVVRFDASQIASSGSPAPAATIDATALGGSPVGLAFDASGNLWVADRSSRDLREFTNPGALTGSSSAAAAVTVTAAGQVDYPLIAFDPPASNLPIQAP